MSIKTQYRIAAPEEIRLNRKPVTGFHFYEKRGDRFVHVGYFTAPGFGLTTEALIAEALWQIESEPEEQA